MIDAFLSDAIASCRSGRWRVTPPTADVAAVLAKKYGADWGDSYWLVVLANGRHAVIQWDSGCGSCSHGAHGVCHEAATVDEALAEVDAYVAVELREAMSPPSRDRCPYCFPFCGCGQCGECAGAPTPKCPYDHAPLDTGFMLCAPPR